MSVTNIYRTEKYCYVLSSLINFDFVIHGVFFTEDEALSALDDIRSENERLVPVIRKAKLGV